MGRGTVLGSQVVLALAGMTAASVATPGLGPTVWAASPATSMSLVDRSTIHVDDGRIVSMSPDGQRFAAVHPKDAYATGSLCTYEIRGAEQIACADLSGLDAGIRLEDVTWSPDGSRIAFTEEAFRYLLDGDLWLMDVATGGLTNLDDDGFTGRMPFLSRAPFDGTITVPSSPTFTPDGTAITYSRTTYVEAGPAGNAIVEIPVAGGVPRVLTHVSLEEPGVVWHGMRWAPDGSRLFYSVAHAKLGDPTNGIWSIGADGTVIRHLVGGPDADDWTASLQVLQVAADGAHLLAWSPPSSYAPVGRYPVFAIVDATTGAVAPVEVLDPAAPPDAFVDLAAISPDGRTLLTQRFAGAPTLDVWVRDLGGSTESPLVTDPATLAGWVDEGIPMTWAPDGTAFLTGGHDVGTATLLRIAGGTASGS